MKFIKFDTLYPSSYLQSQVNSNRSILQSMSFEEMTDWLIGLRLNFSDYYSYNLRLMGWDAKEFFVLSNRYYVDKIGIKYLGVKYWFYKVLYKAFNRFFKYSLIETIIDTVICNEKPDVIFIREQSGINSLFWDKYRNNSLVISRMECGIPKYWSPVCFDLVYTNINSYRDFFKSNRVPTLSNYSGFDERVIAELDNPIDSIEDVIFVGGLGYPTFNEKTDFLERLLKKCDNAFSFAWWGYREGNEFEKKYPLLASCYKGLSGGIDMFRLYKSAKIVVNDYGIAAGGQGMNQRIYEVLGVGGFLLTRESHMFDTWGNVVTTFKDEDDCIQKVLYYLNHEDERIDMCKKGQDFVLKNFNYKDIMKKLSAELQEAYNNKFNNNL